MQLNPLDIFCIHEHILSDYRPMLVIRVPEGSSAEELLQAQQPRQVDFRVRTVKGTDMQLLLALVEDSLKPP